MRRHPSRGDDGWAARSPGRATTAARRRRKAPNSKVEPFILGFLASKADAGARIVVELDDFALAAHLTEHLHQGAHQNTMRRHVAAARGG